jgi:xylulose-5-phosphate/fructose-6-phosphate phosphoketolase
MHTRRVANYLSVGQIYLYDNPLLDRPLSKEHIKPRLLGHWGTTPGLNFIYVYLNRMIKNHDLDMIYITGPGHGGPGLVANAYLEGTYSEVYPNISPDAEGMKRLFTQFSFPGGIPSHVAPETPGSIHEGASSATRSRMRTERRSTTPTSSSPAWSATAKRKPARSLRAGIQTSS